VRVHGAGRTDAGVHALGQCAHADVLRPQLAPERWIAALNGHLPPAIRVLHCRVVPSTFHARYSAQAKTYRYVVGNAAVLPPFEQKRAWHIPEPLDFEMMAKAAADFRGEHDFAAFAANRGKQTETTVRTIHDVRARRAGSRLVFEFTGNGFLYKMVRLMVGLLAQVGRGAVERTEVRRRLAQPRARETGSRFVAPADGLILVRVRY
jgi:tRNA pseudouridine38-40 synthase